MIKWAVSNRAKNSGEILYSWKEPWQKILMYFTLHVWNDCKKISIISTLSID